jgi:hypothetical protein
VTLVCPARSVDPAHFSSRHRLYIEGLGPLVTLHRRSRRQDEAVVWYGRFVLKGQG